MNTDTLMSSLREMIQAEAKLQAMECDGAPWYELKKEEMRLQYSRHETVVREQLQLLGDEASRYKREPRF